MGVCRNPRGGHRTHSFCVASQRSNGGQPAATHRAISSARQRVVRPSRIGRGRRPLEFSAQTCRVDTLRSLATSLAESAKRGSTEFVVVLMPVGALFNMESRQVSHIGFDVGSLAAALDFAAFISSHSVRGGAPAAIQASSDAGSQRRQPRSFTGLGTKPVSVEIGQVPSRNAEAFCDLRWANKRRGSGRFECRAHFDSFAFRTKKSPQSDHQSGLGETDW